MDRFDRRRVLRDAVILACVFALLLAVGTIAFLATGEHSREDAFYRTIGAVTTNDFVGEAPTRGAQRMLAAGLAVAGGLFYLALVGSVVRTLLVPGVARALRTRWERRRVSRMSGHFIVCGYGNIGRAVATELLARGRRVVVIDCDPAKVDAARRDGAEALRGEAHDTGCLLAARIGEATALIAAVGSDAENIYIGIAAKGMRPGLPIIARASGETAQRNMEKAAVFDRVTTPYLAAGRQLASDVLAAVATHEDAPAA